MHPRYGEGAYGIDFDYAILTIEPLDFSKDGVGPICLPTDNRHEAIGSQVTATGWGVTELGGLSSVLMKVNVTVSYSGGVGCGCGVGVGGEAGRIERKVTLQLIWSLSLSLSLSLSPSLLPISTHSTATGQR